MRQYLLDTNVLAAYLQGRPGALSLAQAWIHNDEASTSIVVYGEITEYLKGFKEFPRHQVALRTLLKKVHPYPLTYALPRAICRPAACDASSLWAGTDWRY